MRGITTHKEVVMIYFPVRINFVDEHDVTGSKDVEYQVDDTVYTTQLEQVEAVIDAAASFATAFDNVIDPMLTAVNLTIPIIGNATGLKGAPGEQGSAEGANLRL